MGCCGKKRESLKRQPVRSPERKTTQPPTATELSKVAAKEIFFHNTGAASISVRGPVSGRAYYFPSNKTAVPVDERDAPYFSGISRLQVMMQLASNRTDRRLLSR